MDNIEGILKSEEIDLKRDAEIKRILSVHPKDYYAVLDVAFEADAGVIKKRYRQLAMLIHPDKTSLPDAEKAFDIVKKAELILQARGDDQALAVQEKERLDLIYRDVDQDRKRVREALEDLEFQELQQKELQQRHKINEHAAAKRAEENVSAAAKHKQRWENDRDTRVNLWRSYVSKVEKPKKKKKKKVLA